MRTELFALACCFLLGSQLPAVGQSTDTSKNVSAGSGQPVATLHAKSRIVIVDVVVTDSKGKRVPNLKAADFSILEDKVPQVIRHFEENAEADPSTAPAATQELKMPRNTFTNVVNAPQGSALNVILLDALNTPQETQPFLRSNLKVLADTLPKGSRAAIFGLSNSLVMLQSFTSDPAVLKAILTNPTHSPAAAALQPTGTAETVGALDPMVRSASGAYDAEGYNPASSLSIFNRSVDTFLLTERTRQTIDALTQLSRYLAAIPGRKNLIWLSGSFPLVTIVDTDSAEGGARIFDNSADFSDAVATVSAALSRSRVSIYPIDVRGIQPSPAFRAAQATLAPGAVANDPGRVNRTTSSSNSTSIQERFTMERFAEDTGGHAFYGSNDVASLVKRAINMGANYYTLTYVPSNKDWNGKERRIKVQIEEKHLDLAYRKSYIASEDPVSAANQQTTPESKRTAASSIAAIMQRGAPNPTEILFKLLVTPLQTVDPPSMDKNAKKNLAAVSLHAQRRYRIDYAVNAEDVHWDTADGKHNATVEFMIVGYDEKGDVMNRADRVVPIHLSESEFTAATRGGLKLSQEIAMPANGEYYLRVGILDAVTNHVGGIEIATASLQTPRP